MITSATTSFKEKWPRQSLLLLLPSPSQAQRVNLTPVGSECQMPRKAFLGSNLVDFLEEATHLILHLISCFPRFWSLCSASNTLWYHIIVSVASILLGLLFKSITCPTTESRGDRDAGSLEGLSSCSQVDTDIDPSSRLPKPPHPKVLVKSDEPPASFSAHMEFSMCLLDLMIMKVKEMRGKRIVWPAVNHKLLGGLMDSLAACAVDETIGVALSLASSLLKIDKGLSNWGEEKDKAGSLLF